MSAEDEEPVMHEIGWLERDGEFFVFVDALVAPGLAERKEIGPFESKHAALRALDDLTSMIASAGHELLPAGAIN